MSKIDKNVLSIFGLIAQICIIKLKQIAQSGFISIKIILV